MTRRTEKKSRIYNIVFNIVNPLSLATRFARRLLPQLLLLMLLAQLCSHHTPSPLPFLSHVLSLHSRSILDSTAFSFLLDLNLITRTAYDACVRPGATVSEIREAVLPASGPSGPGGGSLIHRPQGLPAPEPAPLSLSRYARDFVPLKPLGRGTFGAVWSCLSTLTSLPYAVKIVPLEADVQTGSGKVERVLEEVRNDELLKGGGTAANVWAF